MTHETKLSGWNVWLGAQVERWYLTFLLLVLFIRVLVFLCEHPLYWHRTGALSTQQRTEHARNIHSRHYMTGDVRYFGLFWCNTHTHRYFMYACPYCCTPARKSTGPQTPARKRPRTCYVIVHAHRSDNIHRLLQSILIWSMVMCFTAAAPIN